MAEKTILCQNSKFAKIFPKDMNKNSRGQGSDLFIRDVASVQPGRLKILNSPAFSNVGKQN